jgi:hypothetical protein
MKKTPEEARRVPRCKKTGKKMMTYAQARKEAKYLRYHKKYPGETPQAYHCPNCGWHHVGNR